MSTTSKPSMDAFFTRSAANEGIEVPLYLPDGTRTEHFLRIRGTDSDAFRQAEAEGRRKLLEAAAEKDQHKLSAVAVANTELLLCSLIIGWSFEQECNEENKKKLLREAPQIGDAIDKMASRRTLFFKKGSPDSAPSPVPSSS